LSEWSGSYSALIYIGNGNILQLKKICKNGYGKCEESKLFRANIYNAKTFDNLDAFIPCYFQWFKTFDTVFLDSIRKKNGTASDASPLILIRIVKGNINIFSTDVYLYPDIDLVTGIPQCPSLKKQ